ncbi:hypothetical protein [Methylobacterium indicum]|nr:hypothetical protein [Methylobacterium indicum]
MTLRRGIGADARSGVARRPRTEQFDEQAGDSRTRDDEQGAECVERAL